MIAHIQREPKASCLNEPRMIEIEADDESEPRRQETVHRQRVEAEPWRQIRSARISAVTSPRANAVTHLRPDTDRPDAAFEAAGCVLVACGWVGGADHMLRGINDALAATFSP